MSFSGFFICKKRQIAPCARSAFVISSVTRNSHHEKAAAWAFCLCKGGMRMGKRNSDLVRELIRQAREKNVTDVLGSWTGVPWDEWEEPVQDADDL